MRNLLIILLSTCLLFACDPDTTPTPQANNNTSAVDTFSGTLTTEYHNSGTNTSDTIENCQLISTIYGNDSVMRVRLIIPDSSINLSLTAQMAITAVNTDAFGFTRTGTDSCTQMFLKITTDGNNADYLHNRICDPGTDYFFTGTK